MNSADTKAIERLEAAIEVYYGVVLGEDPEFPKTGTLLERMDHASEAIENMSE